MKNGIAAFDYAKILLN